LKSSVARAWSEGARYERMAWRNDGTAYRHWRKAERPDMRLDEARRMVGLRTRRRDVSESAW